MKVSKTGIPYATSALTFLSPEVSFGKHLWNLRVLVPGYCNTANCKVVENYAPVLAIVPSMSR